MRRRIAQTPRWSRLGPESQGLAAGLLRVPARAEPQRVPCQITKNEGSTRHTSRYHETLADLDPAEI
jgi:hypothetical protein